ncbi:class F sortase [Streptomyces sp. P01-B04]|uniref:class F sortase n=1 Tax=Streptomyces poriferorum TaxID=2798799 RepID=UPI001C5D6760|nr:class F sortase [Streptomyces poriferorum]MBW5254905.1 class F sortase [Streptomyces poriferorum]MBW5262716.1 class F sortase [Streptomyces poriferorum]
MPRTTPSLVHACLVLTALTSLTALTGCSDASPSKSPAAVAPTTSTAVTPEAGSSAATGSPAKPAAQPPVHVSIPSLGVDSDIMRLGLNTDGTVEVPPAEKGMTVGWYTGGPVPGAQGPAVLIGHNDTRFGRAVFHDLKKITKGADITVRDAKGAEVHFEVTGRETASKTAFPTNRVYGPTDDRALRLVTCDGAFDAQGHPVDNLIVYATRR